MKEITTILERNVPDVLCEMFKIFGNQSFVKHKAQAFHNYPFVLVREIEEDSFKKIAKVVNHDMVRKDADIIGSHVI